MQSCIAVFSQAWKLSAPQKTKTQQKRIDEVGENRPNSQLLSNLIRLEF